MVLHTENGMLDMGPAATGDEDDPDLTNAGKAPVRAFTKDDGRRLVRACTYPLPGVGCVSRVYTDHAVFEIVSRGASLWGLGAFGTSVEELRARLDAPLEDAAS